MWYFKLHAVGLTFLIHNHHDEFQTWVWRVWIEYLLANLVPEGSWGMACLSQWNSICICNQSGDTRNCSEMKVDVIDCIYKPPELLNTCIISAIFYCNNSKLQGPKLQGLKYNSLRVSFDTIYIAENSQNFWKSERGTSCWNILIIDWILRKYYSNCRQKMIWSRH